ncbi:MAG: hypothetical protein HFE59_06180 [Clostridiales bacterium]|nr:hypothetical protein [Clostridiales bacterium]
MKKEKGSLAIEATIAFTVFLCFMFILMAMVKLSMVYITLNDVTSETVKKVAGMSYPISFANDYIDESFGKIKDATSVDKLFNKGINSFGGKILEKKTNNGVVTNSIIQSIGINIADGIGAKDLLDIVDDKINEILYGFIEKLIDFKAEKQTELAANIYLDLLDKTEMPINKSNVTVKYFSFPMSEMEFTAYKKNIADLTGLEESELDKDDVVLVIEYDYQIIVPFFPAYDVKLKSMAIEKAWLYGGNHVVPEKREGIPIKNAVINKEVYITNTGSGKKYHNEGCITLVRSKKNGNVQKISLSEAKGNYEPCRLCKPEGYKPKK